MEKMDLHKLTEAVGGRFKFTYLLQSRMRELQRGLPPLVEEVEGKSWLQIAAEEVARGKIRLVYGEEAEELRKSGGKPPDLVEEGGTS